MRDIVFAYPTCLARELSGAKIIHKQKPSAVQVFLKVGGVVWVQVYVSRLGKISKWVTEQLGTVDVDDFKRSRACFHRRDFAEDRGKSFVAIRVIVMPRRFTHSPSFGRDVITNTRINELRILRRRIGQGPREK